MVRATTDSKDVLEGWVMVFWRKVARNGSDRATSFALLINSLYRSSLDVHDCDCDSDCDD